MLVMSTEDNSGTANDGSCNGDISNGIELVAEVEM